MLFRIANADIRDCRIANPTEQGLWNSSRLLRDVLLSISEKTYKFQVSQVLIFAMKTAWKASKLSAQGIALGFWMDEDTPWKGKSIG